MVGRDAPADVEKTDDKFRHVTLSEQRFQSAQHDHSIGRKPEGTKHIPRQGTKISEAVQNITGVSVGDLENLGITVQAHNITRPDVPDWVRDPKMLDDYFLRRWDIGYGSKITGALDRFILEDYYLSNHTDKIIFQEHESSFEEERRVLGRKDRWTSSPDAVKHRREKLLRDRERFYEPPKPWTRSSWRGILLSTASGEWGALQLHGIATQKRKRKAAKIADFYGLHGRFWEPAEIIADIEFEDRPALDSWMTDHDIPLDDVTIDDLKWR
jgi:hypothetical protein